jgi:hypothetical protein
LEIIKASTFGVSITKAATTTNINKERKEETLSVRLSL